MSIAGIDFTAIADFREKVSMKLTADNTVDVPLVNLRDAAKAQLLLKEADMLRTRFAVLQAQVAQDVEDTQIGTEDVNVNMENGLQMTEAIMSRSTERLQQQQVLHDASDELATRILSFVEPYLRGIMITPELALVDHLKVIEPRHTLQLLECMTWGAFALNGDPNGEAPESGKSASKKKKRG